MHYIVSPEFHRNLWLKFTPMRLAAAPAVLAILLLIFYSTPGMDPLLSIRNYFPWLFYAIVIIWGNYEAAGAIHEEIKEKTWDFQRMSSISPAQLMLGKMFGATSYIWYAGLMVLAVFAVAYAAYDGSFSHTSYVDKKQLTESFLAQPSLPEFFLTMAYMVIAGIFGHAVAFLSGCVEVFSLRQRNIKDKTPKSAPYFFMGFLTSHYIFSTMAMGMMRSQSQWQTVFERNPVIDWYDVSFDIRFFTTASLLLFLAWTMTGIHRLAKAELMYRQTPLAWVGFVATVSLFLTGLLPKESDNVLFVSAYISFMITAAFVYFTMVFEAFDITRYRRLAFHYAQKNWRRVLETLPKWLATLPLLLLFYVLVSVAFMASGADPHSFRKLGVIFLAVLSLFMLRDGLVVHGLQAYGANRRHAYFFQAFYYVMAYFLLPWFYTVFFGIGHFSMIDNLRGLEKQVEATASGFMWFFPIPSLDLADCFFPAIAESVVAFLWLKHRQKKTRIE